MTGFKSALASKTVWSGLVGILATILMFFFGVTVDPATQAMIVDQAVGAVTALVLLASSIGAIVFRITARKQIGAVDPGPGVLLLLGGIVLAYALLAGRPVVAHEWFADHRYTTADGAHCCNGRDCRPYEAAKVSLAPSGYVLHDGVTVPFAQAHQSQDDKFWRCDWGGRFRCLFVVVGGS